MSNFSDLLNKSRGYNSFEKKEAEVEERMKGQVQRFYLPPQKDSKVIFLDDDPPIIEEHQLKINGRWTNWFTCRKMLGERCIICDELGDSPYTIGFYTILDLSEYQNKKGETVKNTIKIFAPKFKALQMIKRASQKRGGLTHWVCDIYRSAPDAFNVGDVFEWEEKTDADAIKQLNPDAEVANYAEILAPKTNEELKKILNMSTENSMGSGTDEMDEEEVNF